jgi:tetratricopeptide (TPR) repeat protein
MSPNSAAPADVNRLRTTMTEQGRTTDEIAAEVRILTRCSPLAAYRMAHGWSQPHAVEQYNRIIGHGYLDQPTLSRLERFPLPSDPRGPQATQLVGLATLYDTSPLRLVPHDARHKLDPAERAVLLQLPTTPTLLPTPNVSTVDSSPSTMDAVEDIGFTGTDPIGPASTLDRRRSTVDYAGLSYPNHPTRQVGQRVLLPEHTANGPGVDAEIEALELARRVQVSDVSDETLTRLQRMADRTAMSYAGTPPAELLPRVRHHLGYVTALTEGRMTIAQRRALLITGGWLSLLAATLHIDLRQGHTAEAWLITAEQMARQAGHDEIIAWCYETRAWDVLTAGRYRQALDLSRQAQAIAPAGSSAMIQATAQEGRASARMGRSAETRSALNRVTRLVSNLATPDDPEHHYRYDPAKAISYTATTLSWVGDPAAEEFARTAIDELSAEPGGVPRPRRVASARLDLGLALLAAGKPDEASAEALAAVTSGRIVPSNWWRAVEVLHGVEEAGVPEAKDLHEAYRAYRPAQRQCPTATR